MQTPPAPPGTRGKPRCAGTQTPLLRMFRRGSSLLPVMFHIIPCFPLAAFSSDAAIFFVEGVLLLPHLIPPLPFICLFVFCLCFDCFCLFFLAFACFYLLVLAFVCFCLLLLAFACLCLLVLAFACFCLLLLAFASCCLLLLAFACFSLLLLLGNRWASSPG